MLKVGITGGIGSGKTTVASIFKLLGIPVYNADYEAKKLMVNDEILIDGIIKLLGKESYLENGELNRKYISNKIFKDPDLLSRMNRLIHPAVQIDFEKWVDKQNNKPYILKEAAILFESGSYKDLNFTIMVSAPLALRIKRVCSRDNVSEEKVIDRINNQMSDEEKLKLTDFIVINDGKHSLLKQILSIHKELKKISLNY